MLLLLLIAAASAAAVDDAGAAATTRAQFEQVSKGPGASPPGASDLPVCGSRATDPPFTLATVQGQIQQEVRHGPGRSRAIAVFSANLALHNADASVSYTLAINGERCTAQCSQGPLMSSPRALSFQNSLT